MLRPKISRLRRHPGWSRVISTSTNSDLKRESNRDFLQMQGEFRTLRRTRTRSHNVAPEFVSTKFNRVTSERKRTVFVFTTVFTVSLLWSLSAMSAVPPGLSEVVPVFCSAPAPKLTSIRGRGAMLELVIACFPGEAIVTRPRRKNEFLTANMTLYKNLSGAMNEACQRGDGNALGVTFPVTGTVAEQLELTKLSCLIQDH